MLPWKTFSKNYQNFEWFPTLLFRAKRGECFWNTFRAKRGENKKHCRTKRGYFCLRYFCRAKRGNKWPKLYARSADNFFGEINFAREARRKHFQDFLFAWSAFFLEMFFRAKRRFLLFVWLTFPLIPSVPKYFFDIINKEP